MTTGGTSPNFRADLTRLVIIKSGDFDSVQNSGFDGSQMINTFVRSSSTTFTLFQDGTQIGSISSLTSTNFTFNQFLAGITSGVTDYWLGQEFVLWESDNSTANRTGIEQSMDDYFVIT